MTYNIKETETSEAETLEQLIFAIHAMMLEYTEMQKKEMDECQSLFDDTESKIIFDEAKNYLKSYMREWFNQNTRSK